MAYLRCRVLTYRASEAMQPFGAIAKGQTIQAALILRARTYDLCKRNPCHLLATNYPIANQYL